MATEQVYIDIRANGAVQSAKKIKGVEQSVKNLDKTTAQSSKSIASSWDSIGRAAASAGIATAAVSAATKLDALRTRLEVVEGSADAADRKFKELRKTADSLGINFQVLLDSYSKFKAAADGGTLSQEALNDVFMKFTRASAAMKLSALDTERVFRSLYQMASKGVVSMEELKNQLGDSLPKAMPLAAKAMNMTTQELMKQVEAGKILAEDLLPKLADAYEKEFGSKVAIAARSVTAQLQRMVNAFVDSKDAVLLFLQTTGVLKGLTEVVNTISIAAMGASVSFRMLWDTLSGLEESSEGTKKALAGLEEMWRKSSIGVFTRSVKALATKYMPILGEKITVLASDLRGLITVLGLTFASLTLIKVISLASATSMRLFAGSVGLAKVVTTLLTKSVTGAIQALAGLAMGVAYLTHADFKKWVDKQVDSLIGLGDSFSDTLMDITDEAAELLHMQDMAEYKPIKLEDLVNISQGDVKSKIAEISSLLEGFKPKYKDVEYPRKAEAGSLDFNVEKQLYYTPEQQAEIEKLNADLDDLVMVLEDTTGTVGDKIKTELDGMKEGYKEVADHWGESATRMKDITKSAMDGIGDSITNMVMGGKANFSDLTRSIVAMMVKMRVMQAMTGMGFFHGGTPEVKHSGGYIGGSLPSHHSGSLRQDERIAKLQVGEAVVNRAGASRNRGAIAAMNAGQTVGGQTVQQTTAEIKFEVTAIDSASFNNYLVGNRQTIENIINRSLATNGSVRQTIKQVV
jgi:tape measure domain-containing protein